MSGRSRPSAVVVDRCSSKSQCSAIPAALTALRSVISPQRPLVCGDRKRSDQVPGLFLQLLVAEMQRRHALVQRGVGTFALDFHVPQPALVPGEGLAQRVQSCAIACWRWERSPCVAVRTSLSLESARVRNCSLFFANACADSSEKAPARKSRSCSARTRRLDLRRAQQVELRNGDGTGRLGGRRRLRHRLQLGRQRRRLGLRVGETPFGQAGGARGTGQARHVPGQTDGEAGCEADDHPEDHEANVTTGCVNDGDHPLALARGPHRPRSGGRQLRNGAGNVTRMPFKLGGSTKTIPEDVGSEDLPHMQIGPLVTEQPLWPRTMPEPHEVDRLFAEAFALGWRRDRRRHARAAGGRPDAAKELVKRDEVIDN